MADTMRKLGGTLVVGMLAAGCGRSAELARPQSPVVPYAANQTSAASAAVQNPNRRLVAHWTAADSATLSHQLHRPGQLVVVRFDQAGIYLLPDCLLSGAYTPLALTPHGGRYDTQTGSTHGVSAVGVAAADVSRDSAAVLDFVISEKRRDSRWLRRFGRQTGTDMGGHRWTGVDTDSADRVDTSQADGWCARSW